MLMDKLIRFSNEQAVTTSAESSDVVDQVAAGDAVGDEMELYVNVDTAFVGGTSINIQLQTDDNESFSSATTLVESGAVVTASLVAGYKWRVRVPKGMQQYIRVYYTVSGTYTAGNISAHLVAASDVSIND